MLARIQFTIPASRLLELLTSLSSESGIILHTAYNEGQDFYFSAKGHKIKFRIVSHKNAFLGIELRTVIVGGFLKVPGKGLALFKGLLLKSLSQIPFMKLNVAGDTIFAENLLCQRVTVENGKVSGEVFIKE